MSPLATLLVAPAISPVVHAQTFRIIHSFTPSDGRSPNGPILIGNTLYGATSGGGNDDNGVLYKVNTDGSGFAVLHVFNQANDGYAYMPQADLVSDGAISRLDVWSKHAIPGRPRRQRLYDSAVGWRLFGHDAPLFHPLLRRPRGTRRCTTAASCSRPTPTAATT